MDIKERFAELVKKRDEAKIQIVQLETKIESTRESISNIENLWKEKYGVSSPEEIEKIKESLEKEVETIMSECEKYLDKVEQ